MLTLAFIYALLLCAGFLLGEGEYNQPIYRVLGASGVAAMSILLFATVRYWVGWFLGVLGYLVLKTVFALLLGSSLVRPQLWFVEFALLLGLAVLLCARYVGRKLQKVEAVALVGLVVALSFALVLNSNVPVLLGVAVLVAVQFGYARKRRAEPSDAG